MVVTDWSKYKNFTKSEFDCKDTGENQMQEEFMSKLQELRNMYGKPITITSGFRSLKHHKEIKKSVGGMHTKGLACDIGCHSDEAYNIIKLAFKLGFTGIGISQKDGLPRFIHLDMRDIPRVYSY